jgi:hypothetical protein
MPSRDTTSERKWEFAAVEKTKPDEIEVTTMGKHTPEPWYVRNGGTAISDSRDAVSYFPIATNFGVENATRAVACVNALGGIPDPAAYIKAAKDLHEAAEAYYRHPLSVPRHAYAKWPALGDALDALRTLSTPESEVKCGSSQAALDNSKKEASDAPST